MPVLKQSRIYRADLRANRDVRYLFGDNVQRVGLGGQAREMRGEPNAFGVATKWAPGNAAEDFFSDVKNWREARAIITADLDPAREWLRRGGLLVIPLDGLGTGLSEMPGRCPKLFVYLSELLQRLEFNASAYPSFVH